MYPSVLGLGAKLRAILALLDGDVQQIYDSRGVRFRPRFFPIVRELLRAGPSRVGDIASAIRVTQPAATQTIAEMRKLGLLENAPSADRRETRVALTPAGTQLARDLVPIWQAVEAPSALAPPGARRGHRSAGGAALPQAHRRSFSQSGSRPCLGFFSLLSLPCCRWTLRLPSR
jgi:MarR family transcriptional regulator, organic hydroperoxide resistance regulator